MSTEPSMEDILASIRKILSDETMDAHPQGAASEVAPPPAMEDAVQEQTQEYAPADTPASDEVFDLSSTQVVQASSLAPVPAQAAPAPVKSAPLVAQQVAKASACTLSYLAQRVAEDKLASLGQAGLTIEEIVKETVRPIVTEWLNANLYDIVEKLVRKEIEKVVDKVEV